MQCETIQWERSWSRLRSVSFFLTCSALFQPLTLILTLTLAPTPNLTPFCFARLPACQITVQHPAAKTMIEISRTQDEQVGDGTTSVIILAGEMLAVAAEFMEQQMHPITVIGAYMRALDDVLKILDTDLSIPVDVEDRERMIQIVQGVIGTKMIKKWCAGGVDQEEPVLSGGIG